MKKNLSNIIKILVAAFIMAVFFNISSDAYAEGEITKAELTQDTENHTFSNASDGSFVYSYAKKEDYYKGYAVDESTGLKYAFISYEDKLYAVVISSKYGYKGSYDTTALTELSSQSYNPVTSKTVIKISKNKTGNELLENGFYYDDEFSIITTGWSVGTYYIKGKKAKGIQLVDDSYCYFLKGKQITKKGWYKYGTSYIYVKNQTVKYKFNGTLCYKYSGTNKKKVTSTFINVDGVQYRFDKKGALAQGFYEIKGDYYYFKNGLYKTKYLKKVNGKVYYFGEDGKAVKSTWVNVKKTVRYFAASAENTRIYYTSSYSDKSLAGKLKLRKKNKWSYYNSGLYWVNDNLIYFKNGTTSSSTCWYTATSGVMYYIKSGTPVYQLKSVNKGYSLKTLVNNKWVKATNVWTPAHNGMQLYFDNTGAITYKYFTQKYATTAYRRSVWKYNASKDKWSRVKNQLVSINGYYFCVSDKGTLVKTEGWYSFSDKSAAYAASNGRVNKYIYYDSQQGCSIYKTGTALTTTTEGLVTALIGSKTVYYLSDATGRCLTGDIVYGNYIYQFDEYGRAYSRRMDGVIGCDSQTWLNRVIASYLGVTGIDCNTFVNNALAYVGDDDSSIKLNIRYQDNVNGGIILNSSATCTQWGGTASVSGKAVLSDGTDWLEADDITLNDNIVDFSYDELHQGDLIIFYKEGETEASHMAIYLGRFVSAEAVRNYLTTIGVSKSIRDACVKDWGQYYDNDGTYWCIHGGMGSSRQVYISNSCYTIPSGSTYTYGRKIVHLFE
jgi:cell wall-associated NlpC family hydrolase